MKNKVLCVEHVDLPLKEEIANKDLKLKAYKISSYLVQAYHDKNQEDCKVGIGFDYNTLKNRKI